MSDFVLLSIDDRGVATVSLNRPDKHNAFDDVMIAELISIFNSLDNNPLVRVVLLVATGKSFSAGGDLNWMRRMAEYDYQDNLSDARALAEMLRALNQLSKPTIARVQGAAYGGAVGLVSCCDIAIASSKASFSLSEVKIGLVPATISPYVIAAIGAHTARRYFVTGERFSADKALVLGLVSEVVEPEDLDKAVTSMVNEILNNGPQAITQAKQLIADIQGQAIDHTLIENTCERIATIRMSEEGQEGLTAFLEKRPPAWQDHS